jgi:hypothetical protein
VVDDENEEETLPSLDKEDDEDVKQMQEFVQGR